MDDEKLIHDWLINTLGKRLGKDYRDIRVNAGERNHAHEGFYPDLILGNHGHTLAVLEVETEGSISAERAAYWKGLADTGTKLILMVPKTRTADITSLLWDRGIAGRVSVGTYEVAIRMP